MAKVIAVTMGLVAALSGGPAWTAEFDGSAPLLCAVVRVQECDARGGCEAREAAEVDLSQFLRVSVADKKLTAVRPDEEGRGSQILHVGLEGGNLILQGAEAGRGWSMAISEETGKMSGALTAGDAVFVVFGACTRD